MAVKKKKIAKKVSGKSVFWPVVLIFVGAFLLAFNLGLLPKQMIQYWPILLVVLGLIGLSGNI